MERNRPSAAFTRFELIVVLFVISVLATVFVIVLSRGHSKAERICCTCNLKQIGIAYRVWANDHFNKNPAEAFMSEGGWKDHLTNQTQGAFCWTNYAIMQNELGQSPLVLVCPADDRTPVTNFTLLKSNTNISFFVGAGADDNHPQAILGGDRNLGRGLLPDPACGFSPANGLGNDVAIQTNSTADPISWSLKMHSTGKQVGAGNILLGDASVQQTTSARFRTDYQRFALDNGNWPSNHLPSAPSFRLIFP